jgi:phenylacetate-CoA ligase
MPLVRYNLADNVEVSYGDCGCGWQLPTIRVLGRAAFGYPVGEAKITQHRLEELVFELPIEHEVLFWRAKAEPDRLRVEIEVPDSQRVAACAALTASIRDAYRVECDVQGVPVGTLVPTAVLTAVHDVVKPRSLFGADEDWSKALLYH